jgi:hypothetical protein
MTDVDRTDEEIDERRRPLAEPEKALAYLRRRLDGPARGQDQVFVVSAIRALVDEVDRLRAEVERLRA